MIDEEMHNTNNLSIFEILDKILTTVVPQRLKPVFFVDLCYITYDDQDYTLDIVQLALKARTVGWYVVAAYSSGGGWRNDRSTFVWSSVNSNLETLQSGSDMLVSSVFNDTESKKFIDIFHVDVDRLEKGGIEVANNPYLLNLFRGTVSDSARFFKGVELFWTKIWQLTRTFICTLDDPVYAGTFNSCLSFLECARQNAVLTTSQLQEYTQCYLHREYLTTLESDKVKLCFPPMYKVIVDQLKNKFEDHVEKVLALPIVKGYVFESRFLQSKSLHQLIISAVMEEAVPPKTFTFSSLISASVQELGPIEDELIENKIYHLRPGHPAIDGVCLAVDSENHKYLLLLQISLSEYRKHESKGIDIRNQVQKKFEGTVHRGTIAEYYKHLANVEDENVIYVYVSPEEGRPPSCNTFCQELRRHDTRTGSSSPPQYLYGFCVDSDTVIERCVPN